MSDLVTAQQLQVALDELEGRLRPLISQLQGEPWHEVSSAREPGFQGSWSNFGATYETVAFRLVNPLLIALKGSARGGASGSVIFTLPNRSYWPAAERRLPVAAVDGAGTLFPVLLVVTRLGVVNVYAPGTSGAIDELHLETMLPL